MQGLSPPGNLSTNHSFTDSDSALVTYIAFSYNILSPYFSNPIFEIPYRLSSGWIIKIGRGLDFFKAPEHKFCLGVYDLDLRSCHETTVDIFHSKNVKQSYG